MGSDENISKRMFAHPNDGVPVDHSLQPILNTCDIPLSPRWTMTSGDHSLLWACE